MPFLLPQPKAVLNTAFLIGHYELQTTRGSAEERALKMHKRSSKSNLVSFRLPRCSKPETHADKIALRRRKGAGRKTVFLCPDDKHRTFEMCTLVNASRNPIEAVAYQIEADRGRITFRPQWSIKPERLCDACCPHFFLPFYHICSLTTCDVSYAGHPLGF